MFEILLFIFFFNSCDLNQNVDIPIQLEATTNHKQYRRFEILISNFRHLFTKETEKICENNLRNCILVTDVSFNYLNEKREIFLDSEYDVNDGIYLFHKEIWNEPTLNGDMQSVFGPTNTLKFSITIKKRSDLSVNEVILIKTYANLIAVPPNIEKYIYLKYISDKVEYTEKSEDGTLGIYVSYRCKGYTGSNCQFECYDTTNKWDCFYENGDKICKDPQYNNPPDCNQNVSRCPVSSSPLTCENGGTCFRFEKENYMCVCQKGYRGKLCQEFYCETPCEPNYGICSGPNTCKCLFAHKAGKFCNETKCKNDLSSCQNKAPCSVYENEIFCKCNPEEYTGRLCEFTCDPKCVFGICTHIEKETFCQCFKGFTGKNCAEEIEKLKPEFKLGYVSGRKQNITYISLFFTLFFTTVIVLGFAMFLRKNIQRNVEIITRAEAAMTRLNVMETVDKDTTM